MGCVFALILVGLLVRYLLGMPGTPHATSTRYVPWHGLYETRDVVGADPGVVPPYVALRAVTIGNGWVIARGCAAAEICQAWLDSRANVMQSPPVGLGVNAAAEPRVRVAALLRESFVSYGGLGRLLIGSASFAAGATGCVYSRIGGTLTRRGADLVDYTRVLAQVTTPGLSCGDAGSAILPIVATVTLRLRRVPDPRSVTSP